MKKLFLLSCLVIYAIALSAGNNCPREKLLMDRGWKFHLGSASSVESDFGYGAYAIFAKAGESYGAVSPGFNDSTWRILDLPHDWMVEQDFVKSNNPNVLSHGYKPAGRLFPETSIGWYRKAFMVPESDRGKRISIRFDGVFRDCKVWLNGHFIGGNMSGYSEFSFDVTDYLWYGKRNVIVVRVDVTQYEGWFYEGAGIYRHVWMEKFHPLHLTDYSVFVRTEVRDGKAYIIAETGISNEIGKDMTFDLQSKILDPDGRTVDSLNVASIELTPGKQSRKSIVPAQALVP